MQNQLDHEGWALLRPRLSSDAMGALRASAFRTPGPGQRCLLNHPDVREVASLLRAELIASGDLPTSAVAIQAIAFDKTPATNWKVTWHQDLMFPFARAVNTPGFDLPTTKEDVHYARPPRHVLETLLAVRLHFDDCDESNGPLRVAAGSHWDGVFKSAEILSAVARCRETQCLAREGDALLMRPLLLHASSPATAPSQRRVIHLVYHSGEEIPEPWHRTLK